MNYLNNKQKGNLGNLGNVFPTPRARDLNRLRASGVKGSLGSLGSPEHLDSIGCAGEPIGEPAPYLNQGSPFSKISMTGGE